MRVFGGVGMGTGRRGGGESGGGHRKGMEGRKCDGRGNGERQTCVVCKTLDSRG